MQWKGMIAIRTYLAKRSIAPSSDRAWIVVILAISLYTLLRVVIIPTDAESTFRFSSDSAYHAIVAKNLLAGKGYVNDAHMFVFLNPDKLPMPFHNSNPLFTTLIAAISFVSGTGVLYSGFLLSAVSSGLLVLALTHLGRHYTGNWITAFLIGLCAAIFPPVLMESFRFLTDSLCASFFFASVAALVHLKKRWHGLGAGLLFGLAWLIRSQVILALPAILLYTVLRWGWRQGVGRFAAIILATALVASPWLIHKHRAWENPLLRNAPYALMQDINSQKYDDGSGIRARMERYYHSPEVPPGILSFINKNPLNFANHLLKGIPKVVKKILRDWSMRSYTAAIILGIAVLFFCVHRRRVLSPEGLAIGLYGLTTLFVFSIRGESYETRFFNTLSVFFALFAAAGCLGVWDSVQRLERPVAIRFVVAILIAVLWVGIVPVKALEARRFFDKPYHFLVSYRQMAAEVNERFAKGRPVVVGSKPYFYTLETNSPALSIPEASDRFLLDYMDKYGAEYILLTDFELRFWRPSWLSPAAIPSELKLVTRIGTAYLFGRKEEHKPTVISKNNLPES
jgi:4-amino-4-deoxy-L-arabinose transferase-like glycosyltransferase